MAEKKKALAIPWYDLAIPELEEMIQQGDKAEVIRRSLRNCHWPARRLAPKSANFFSRLRIGTELWNWTSGEVSRRVERNPS